jgi:disulfide bond formation protein DsbB
MWENHAMRIPPRAIYAFIFVACAGLLADAIFYMQEQLGLEPCPMCIVQRYAFIAVGVVALVAAIHGPRERGRIAYSSLIVLCAIAGAGVAIRHSYLQHYPPKMETCGTDLEFLLDTFPLTQALPKIFAGSGSCSAVTWKFLGLSIPEWSLAWFVIFVVLAIWAARRRVR